jgi:hypothetical protein
MVKRSVTDCSAGRSEGQATAVELISRAKAELGGLVDDLVEGRKDVICEGPRIIDQ